MRWFVALLLFVGLSSAQAQFPYPNPITPNLSCADDSNRIANTHFVHDCAGGGGGGGTVTSLSSSSSPCLVLIPGPITAAGTIDLQVPLSVPCGGSGDTSLTAHNVLLGEDTAAVAFAAPSTDGFVLTSNGSTSDPTFQAPSAGSGTACGTNGVAGQDCVSTGGAGAVWGQEIIGPSAAASSGSAGTFTLIQGGNGDGVGHGGDTELVGGTGGTTGAGGSIDVTSGDAGSAGNGAGGSLFVQTGTGYGTGAGGQIQLNTGDSRGSSNGGDLNVTLGYGLGSSTARGGDINLLAGLTGGSSTGRGGNVLIAAGDHGGTGSPGQGGDVAINAGGSVGALVGGSIDISAAGSSGGDGGIVELDGGSANSGNSNGGNVTIVPGSPAGSGTIGALAILPSASGSTVPATPTGGFVIYIDPADGKLKAKGSSGTVTTIASP